MAEHPTEFEKHFHRSGDGSVMCRSCGAMVGQSQGWKTHLTWHYALDGRLREIATDARRGASAASMWEPLA